jgi:hypothetical protein
MAFDRHTAIAAVVTSGVSHRFLRTAGIMRTTQTRREWQRWRRRRLPQVFAECRDYENDTDSSGMAATAKAASPTGFAERRDVEIDTDSSWDRDVEATSHRF